MLVPEGEFTIASLKLTRETILDGSVHATIRAMQGPGVRYMTDAERAQSIETMLANAPRPDRVWVFGYGSLIWNPAFHFAERRIARLYGYHRQFCLRLQAGRGSPESPGLMLALERGGSCHGVAYRIAPHHLESELDVLWRREMGSMSYQPVWAAVRTPKGIEHAIALTVNRHHERYVRGLAEEETVRLLMHGVGPLGSCCEYLFDTVAHMRELGIRDRRLERLEAAIRQHLDRS